MLTEISYYQIFGKPMIVYLGILVILMIIITALIAILRKKGKTKIPIIWHYRLAYITIILGLIHGMLGILAYL